MVDKITIAFIIQDEVVPAWYYHSITNILNEGHSISFIKLSQKRKSEKYPIVLQLFHAFERWWFRKDEDAFQPISVGHLLHQGNTLSVSGWEPQEEEILQLQNLSIDIFYSINYYTDQAEGISKYSRLGLWFIKLGIENHSNNKVPGLWELMHAQPVAGSYLLMKKNSSLIVLEEGTTAVVPHSVYNTNVAVAWKSASYVSYRVRTLAQLGAYFLEKFQQPFHDNSSQTVALQNRTLLSFIGRNFSGYLRHRKWLKEVHSFQLYYTATPFHFDLTCTSTFKTIKPPHASFFADPFLIKHNDKQYVLFEGASVRGKGSIYVTEIKDTGYTEPEKVLEQPYHLSYPFVFAFENEFYMIPETSENKTVELYRATSFPYNWVKEKDLLQDVLLIDVTLHYHEGLWWMFAVTAPYSAASVNDILLLYYSTDFRNEEWMPHPLNPIKSTADNCRPAGKVFTKNGLLYRPAQNNASKQYGYSLVINKIETLSPLDYSEKEVVSFDPKNLGLRAIHHIDHNEHLTIIDGIPL